MGDATSHAQSLFTKQCTVFLALVSSEVPLVGVNLSHSDEASHLNHQIRTRTAKILGKGRILIHDIEESSNVLLIGSLPQEGIHKACGISVTLCAKQVNWEVYLPNVQDKIGAVQRAICHKGKTLFPESQGNKGYQSRHAVTNQKGNTLVWSPYYLVVGETAAEKHLWTWRTICSSTQSEEFERQLTWKRQMN
jgi:hypothetical protein